MGNTTKSVALAIALLGGVSVGALALSQVPSYAQSHQGGSGGGSGGHTDTTHTDDGHEDGEGGKGGKGGKQYRGGRSGVTQGRGQSGKSLRDIFNDMEDAASFEAEEGHGASEGRKGQGGQSASGAKKGGQATAGTKGQKGKPATAAAEEEEDSDRPEWAGVPGKDGKPGRGSAEPGTKKGGLYADLVEILRGEDGVPILVQLPNGEWVVQPVDADGNSLIQIVDGAVVVDADGEPVYSGTPTEVDLGRLNVGRSPHSVLAFRYDDVIATINSDEVTSVSLDASGRLVLTTTTVIVGDNPATLDVAETEYFATKTIDSPLENLGIYYEILTTGGLTGIDVAKLSDDVQNLADTSGFTIEDLTSMASFLAGAADKFGSLTQDVIVYMNNNILKVTYDVDADNLPAVPLVLNEDGTIKTIGDFAFVDYAVSNVAFSYDRAATYDDVTVYVLVKQDDGTYKPELVDLYTAVFGDTNATGTALDGFTRAADDALQVIEFVHEYEVPADSTATN